MIGIALPPNKIDPRWEYIEIQFEKSIEYNLDWKYLDPRYGVHAPYYVTLSNPKQQKGDYAIHQVIEAGKAARKLNADIVVVRAGFYSKQEPKEAMEVVVRNCEEILKNMDVPLGIETQAKHTQFGTMDEVMELADKIGIVPVLNLPATLEREEVDWNIISAMKNPYIHFDETMDLEKLADALPEKYTLVAESQEAIETMETILSPY